MSNPVERRTTSLPTIGSEAGTEAPRLPPPSPPRRASRTIMLALVGVGIAAVGYGVWSSLDEGEEEEAQQRNGYTTQQECEANYSKEQCTQGQTYRPGLGFMPIFWGPFYRDGSSLLGRTPNDPGPGRVSRGTVVEKATPTASRRGGFGSSSTARSGGGSIGG